MKRKKYHYDILWQQVERHSQRRHKLVNATFLKIGNRNKNFSSSKNESLADDGHIVDN